MRGTPLPFTLFELGEAGDPRRLTQNLPIFFYDFDQRTQLANGALCCNFASECFVSIFHGTKN